MIQNPMTTPRLPPSPGINPKPLPMHPLQSCLSRPGPSLLLSPHNPLIQPRLIYRRPLNPLRRSRISTLLPRGGHITRSRPLVGGGLDRRRPSLRLTRIHLPLLPLRGPIHRRQTQNAATIALTNAPFPHEWILVILKISRPVIQNPTTTPRVPPNIFVNPESLPTHPFQSCLKRLGPSLLLSPQNPLIQPLLIYPRPLNLLLLPSRSTPRLPPSLGVNTNPLSTQPSPSCRSRPGPSLLLSPRNPLSTPRIPPNRFPNRDPGTTPFSGPGRSRPGPSLLFSPRNPLVQPLRPLTPLPLPSRNTPRFPPSPIVNPKPFSTRPFQSCRSRLGPSLVLSPRNPLLQPRLLIYRRPPYPLRLPRISILLPRVGHTTRSRPLVGGALPQAPVSTPNPCPRTHSSPALAVLAPPSS